MSVLLVLVLFAVLQVAVYVYVRNVVGASAADGARYAATVGADVREGGSRAAALIASGLSGASARRIRCRSGATRDPVSGLAVVEVRCAGKIRPVLLPLGIPIAVNVAAMSLREVQP